MHITMDDVKKKQIILEQTITELINLFQEETGLTVENIMFIETGDLKKAQAIITSVLK